MNKAYFQQLSTGRRLGTGSFGTVYDATSKSGEKMALKILLLKDEEIIKSVMLERKIMKAINYINCSNFIRLVGASIKYGKFLRVSEEDKNDPDDGKKEKQEEDIPKLLLLLSKGGCELENFMVKSKDEIISIIIQVAATMAMGEEMLELEHRDAHVSNILVEKTKEKELEYLIGGKKIIVKSNNILIKMIDFGKSRLQNGNEVLFCDDWELESNESNPTEERGELHYQIYPRMNEIIGGNWKDYFPKTNVLWIRYLIEILSGFDASGLTSEDLEHKLFEKLKEAKRNKQHQRLEKKLQMNFLKQ